MVDVVVEFDYDAEQPDELTIRVGDVIKHVIMSEGGWWEGELNGKKGMFPDNFVKVIEKREHKEEKKESKVGGNQRASVRELASKLKDGVHVGPVIPGKKKDTSSMKHKKAKVLFDYEPENEDELKIDVGDIVDVFKQEEEGWWEGSLNGKVGVFPSNFVEIIEEPEPEKTDKPPEEDKHTEPQTGIKGKKIIGVGLGNIFQGGPIKLRSTAASETKEKETKPVEEPQPASPVVKREKPELVTRTKRKLTSTPPQSDTKIGNKAIPTFTPSGTVDNDVDDNFFNVAYDSDTSIHSSDVLLSMNEKLSMTDSEERLTSCQDYPLLQRKESRIKHKYSAMHGAGDYPSLNDSNKENLDIDTLRRKSNEKSKRRRELDMADFFGSYVGYLNRNNSHNVAVAENDVTVGQTENERKSGCITGTFKSGSDTRVSNHQGQLEDYNECPKSAPIPSWSERKDMVFRKPLRPITLKNLNDLDLHRSPFMAEEGKDKVGPEIETSSIRKPEKGYRHNVKVQTSRQNVVEQVEKSTTASESPAREIFMGKPTGYLCSLTQSEHLSPFVKAIAAKYQLLGVKSDKDCGNSEEKRVDDGQQDDTVISYKENRETEGVDVDDVKILYEKPNYHGDFQESGSKIEGLIKRYNKEVTDLRQKYCSEMEGKEIRHQTACLSNDRSGLLLKQHHSDEERLNFERDLEENLLVEMEAYESFIKEGTQMRKQDVFNAGFVADDTEELMIKPRSRALWVSPAHSRVAKRFMVKQNEQSDYSSEEAMYSPYDADYLYDEMGKPKRKNASTSPFAEFLKYDTSMEESFLMESPLKVKTTNPRYSSSPVVEDSDSKEDSIMIENVDWKDVETQARSEEKHQFVDEHGILAKAPSMGWRSKLSLKRLFGRKKRNPVTLLSFSKLEDVVKNNESDGKDIDSESDVKDIDIPVQQVSEHVQESRSCHNKNTMEKSKFIHWDGVTNSIETFFTERLNNSERNEDFYGKYVVAGDDASVEEYTVEDIDFELERCRELLEEAANVTPQAEYDASQATVIRENDTVDFIEPASLGYLALHAFKLHLKSIQEGLLWPSEILKKTVHPDEVRTALLSDDDLVDNGVEVSPDSPSLIDSMTKDIKKLNLTVTPAQSDAEMSQSLNAFLQEALKPIDDLSLQAGSSCSDLSNSDHFDSARDTVDHEDPLSNTRHATFSIGHSNDFRDEEGSDSDSDIFEEKIRGQLKESVDRYPSFTYCSPMSTKVEEDALDEEDEDIEDEDKDFGNTGNGHKEGKSLCSEDTLLRNNIHGIALDADDYIPRYPGMVFARAESPSAPLPTPEDEGEEDLGEDIGDTKPIIVKDIAWGETVLTSDEKGRGDYGKSIDIGKLDVDDPQSTLVKDATSGSSDSEKEGYQKKDFTREGICTTERYPKITLGSLPPLYEDDEDNSSFWNGGVEDTSTPITGSRSRRHRVNEYPSRFLGINTIESSPTKESDVSQDAKVERSCLLSHWTVNEIGKMAKEIVEEMFLDGTITEMQHEIEAACDIVQGRGSFEKGEFAESSMKENNDCVALGDDTERFYTDLDTDADNTLERYFTDYDTSLDGTN